ncbi:MAG: dihydropteroate synthase [Dethiobacteria bacterium]|jgi:dihydropteroate synthase
MTRCRLVYFKNKQEIKEMLQSIGVDSRGAQIMAPKGLFYTILVEELPLKAALLLKQEMLAKGGECAVSRNVASLQAEKSSALLCGTKRQFVQLVKKLRGQPFGLKNLGQQLTRVIEDSYSRPAVLKFKNITYPLGERTLIMGILNVTPDSFSDGGRYHTVEEAVEQALQMVKDGADIIDVGGESTRPGYEEISVAEEIGRIVPVIKAIREVSTIPISVDTYKAAVARAALDAGADMLNDIWGGLRDAAILEVAAAAGLPVCLMHNRDSTQYEDLLSEVVADLRNCAERALAAGVAEENIVLDPGIGFGKDFAQNLEVMRYLQEFTILGYPVLLGTSRKSMVGKALDLPVEQRLEGTAATVAYGIACGVEIVRVHDVLEMSRVVRMTDAICRGGRTFAG